METTPTTTDKKVGGDNEHASPKGLDNKSGYSRQRSHNFAIFGQNRYSNNTNGHRSSYEYRSHGPRQRYQHVARYDARRDHRKKHSHFERRHDYAYRSRSHESYSSNTYKQDNEHRTDINESQRKTNTPSIETRSRVIRNNDNAYKYSSEIGPTPSTKTSSNIDSKNEKPRECNKDIEERPKSEPRSQSPKAGNEKENVVTKTYPKIAVKPLTTLLKEEILVPRLENPESPEVGAAVPAEEPRAQKRTEVVTPESASKLIFKPNLVRRRRHVSNCSNSSGIDASIGDKLANMDKADLRYIINNSDTKYDEALKVQARRRLHEELRRQLKAIKLDKPKETTLVNDLVEDEIVEAIQIPEVLLAEIQKAFGIDIGQKSTEENAPAPSNTESNKSVDEMAHGSRNGLMNRIKVAEAVKATARKRSMERSPKKDEGAPAGPTAEQKPKTPLKQTFEAFKASQQQQQLLKSPEKNVGLIDEPSFDQTPTNEEQSCSTANTASPHFTANTDARAPIAEKFLKVCLEPKVSNSIETSAEPVGKSPSLDKNSKKKKQPNRTANKSSLHCATNTNTTAIVTEKYLEVWIKSDVGNSRETSDSDVVPATAQANTRKKLKKKAQRKIQNLDIIVVESTSSATSSGTEGNADGGNDTASDGSRDSTARRRRLKLKNDAQNVIDSFEKLIMPYLSEQLTQRYQSRYAETEKSQLQFISYVCTSEYNSQKFNKIDIANIQHNLKSSNNRTGLEFLMREIVNVCNHQKQVARKKLSETNVNTNSKLPSSNEKRAEQPLGKQPQSEPAQASKTADLTKTLINPETLQKLRRLYQDKRKQANEQRQMQSAASSKNNNNQNRHQRAQQEPSPWLKARMGGSAAAASEGVAAKNAGIAKNSLEPNAANSISNKACNVGDVKAGKAVAGSTPVVLIADDEDGYDEDDDDVHMDDAKVAAAAAAAAVTAVSANITQPASHTATATAGSPATARASTSKSNALHNLLGNAPATLLTHELTAGLGNFNCLLHGCSSSNASTQPASFNPPDVTEFRPQIHSDEAFIFKVRDFNAQIHELQRRKTFIDDMLMQMQKSKMDTELMIIKLQYEKNMLLNMAMTSSAAANSSLANVLSGVEQVFATTNTFNSVAMPSGGFAFQPALLGTAVKTEARELSASDASTALPRTGLGQVHRFNLPPMETVNEPEATCNRQRSPRVKLRKLRDESHVSQEHNADLVTGKEAIDARDQERASDVASEEHSEPSRTDRKTMQRHSRRAATNPNIATDSTKAADNGSKKRKSTTQRASPEATSADRQLKCAKWQEAGVASDVFNPTGSFDDTKFRIKIPTREPTVSKATASEQQQTTPAGGVKATAVAASPTKSSATPGDAPAIRTGRLCGINSPITQLRVHGEHIIASAEDGDLYKFNLRTHKLVKQVTKHSEAITYMYVCLENSTLYTTSVDGFMKKSALENFERVLQTIYFTEPLQSIDVQWDVAYIGSRWGNVYTYDIAANKANTTPLCATGQSIIAVKATKEGARKILILASKGNFLHLHDADSGLLLRTLSVPDNLNVYSLLLDHDHLYCGTQKNEIYKFDFATGNPEGNLICGNGAISMLLYKEKYMLVGCYDGYIYVLDKASCTSLGRFPGSGRLVLALAVVGDKVVTSAKDNTLEVIDIPKKLFENEA